MTIEKEGIHLQEENQRLREQVAQRDERIQQQDTLLSQQSLLMQQMQEQIAALTQQVKDLQDRLAKNSHNSSLPPSSDRFVRQPKSLRTKSEKQTGGQEGHPGTTLRFSQAPDEVIEHLVSVCHASSASGGRAIAPADRAGTPSRTKAVSPLSAPHAGLFPYSSGGPHPVRTADRSGGRLFDATAVVAAGTHL